MNMNSKTEEHIMFVLPVGCMGYSYVTLSTPPNYAASQGAASIEELEK